MKNSIAGLFALIGLVAIAAGAAPGAKDIPRLDQKATPAEPGKYPKEMVAPGQDEFDGSYKGKVQYTADDKKLTVALWESGPGVLTTDSYPHDEYCLVLEGHLVVTNRSGTKEEFKPGDSFVIPKGWAGTWDMKTKFKKQWVAMPATS